MFRFRVTFLALMLFSNQAFCWGDMGHRLVGSIAEDMISADAKDLVRGIIGIEPMQAAAIWPDLVRDDVRFATRDSDVYDFSPFHFCEIPVGYNYKNKPKKIEKDCLSALKFTQDIIKDPKALRETKMIALRYLIHVVGDSHQPLHVGNGYDRGANACQIRFSKENSSAENIKPSNFHSFWDETMVDLIRESYANPALKQKAPQYMGDVFKAMKKKNPEFFTAEAKKKYGSGHLVDWIQETQSLREGIYPDNPEDMKNIPYGQEFKHRPYCLWYANQSVDKNPAPGSMIDEKRIPVISKEYISKNLPLAEEQILKAGVRLAHMLDEMAKELKNKEFVAKIDDKKQESILRSVQDHLKNALREVRLGW